MVAGADCCCAGAVRLADCADKGKRNSAVYLYVVLTIEEFR